MPELLTVIMTFDDGTEIWYEVEKLTITPDPMQLAGVSAHVIPGAPERPDGPYVEMRGARLARIAGVHVG